MPNPSAAQVNATNTCVANCPQGKGTATDIANYQTCVSNCISNNYYSSSGTPDSPTGSGDSGSGSGTNTAGGSAATGSGSGSNNGGGSTSSGSGSASTTSASKAGGEALRVGTSVVGLLGFLAAFLAL